MNLGGRNTVLTATAIAINMLLLPAGVLSMAYNYPPSTCLGNELAEDGSIFTNFSGNYSYIEIEFRLRFRNNCSNDINHGVRLDVGLQLPTGFDWIPIRKYAQNVNVTEDIYSLDSSNKYLSPLLVKCAKWITIREYFCGEYVQNFTKGMKLDLRWIQTFPSNYSRNYVSFVLDDINIRVWKRTCFLQVLTEDFNRTDLDSYNVKLAKLISDGCGSMNPCANGCDSMNPCEKIAFTGKTSGSVNVTTRFIIVNLTDIPNSCENEVTTATIPTTMTTPTLKAPGVKELILKVISEGNLEKQLDDFISLYNGTLPEAISNTVIESTADILNNIKEADSKAGGRVLKLLDSFGLRGYNSSDGRVSNEIFTLVVRDIASDEYKNHDDLQLKMLHEPGGEISLPGELLSAFDSMGRGIRVASFVFKNLSGIFPIDTEENNTKLGSAVVSSILGCMGRSCNSSDYTLKNPVKIVIRHFSDLSDKVIPVCTFLDLQEYVWSSRGCNRNSTLSNSSFSVCECNHLTHFAILLSPGIEIVGKDKFALETISYLGVAFSVLCMIATIFTLTFLKALRDMRTFIHVNLCICLIVSQVIFITAVDKTGIEKLCQAIAIMLHYFWLTTFMWMLMEGVVLYIVLVHVFMKQPSLYMIGFTVASYGLPAIYVFCVAVPLGLTIKDDQGHPQYGSSSVSQTCWLHYGKHFNWAFISPVIGIIIANIGFLIMAIGIMQKHKKRVREKSLLKNASHWLKTVIYLVVVMGITWITGVFVFHKALTFVAYIFAITTALQGSFIFFLFVVMSKQVKDHYRTWWRSKKGESKLLTNLFSFGTLGRSKTPSISYAVAKVRTLPTKTDDLDKGKAAAAALQLRNMQMVDRREDMSNFEGSTNIDCDSLPNFENRSNTDCSSLLFASMQILDCNGEVCKLENIAEKDPEDPRSCPGKETDQQPSPEDIGNCTVIENEMNSE